MSVTFDVYHCCACLFVTSIAYVSQVGSVLCVRVCSPPLARETVTDTCSTCGACAVLDMHGLLSYGVSMMRIVEEV